MTERGQTIHDYLLGIVLVLLTIAGVFAFFPEVFTPFQEPVDSDEQHMSDRLADEVIQVNQTMRGSQTVNYTGVTETLEHGGVGTLANRSGIQQWKQVNITVVNQTGVVASSNTSNRASVYRLDRGDPAATTTRTIRAQTAVPACEQSCQVVVRVWGG